MAGLSYILNVSKMRVHQFVNEMRMIPDYMDNENRVYFSYKTAKKYAEQLAAQKSLPRKKRRVFQK
jgi:hypothetical protein